MKFTNIVLSGLLVIALCLVTTAFFRQSRIANSSVPLQSELAAAPVAAQASERGPVRMVRFVLMDGGLYPREMRVNQGFINLAVEDETGGSEDRKSTRLNSSHSQISYAVFCLKKKTKKEYTTRT